MFQNKDIMRKLILMISAAVLAFSAVAAPKTYELASPDGTLKAEVVLNGTDITYSVLKDGLGDQQCEMLF